MTNHVTIPEDLVYHEAGHAVMFWFHGIPIEFVSIVPWFAGGRGTYTKTAIDPPETGQGDLEKWILGVAAGDAAEGNSAPTPRVPQPSVLASKLDDAAHNLDDESQDDADDSPDGDYRNSVLLGRLRDQDITQQGTGATTGEDVPVFVELESGGPSPGACRVVGHG